MEIAELVERYQERVVLTVDVEAENGKQRRFEVKHNAPFEEGTYRFVSLMLTSAEGEWNLVSGDMTEKEAKARFTREIKEFLAANKG